VHQILQLKDNFRGGVYDINEVIRVSSYVHQR